MFQTEIRLTYGDLIYAMNWKQNVQRPRYMDVLVYTMQQVNAIAHARDNQSENFRAGRETADKRYDYNQPGQPSPFGNVVIEKVVEDWDADMNLPAIQDAEPKQTSAVTTVVAPTSNAPLAEIDQGLLHLVAGIELANMDNELVEQEQRLGNQQMQLAKYQAEHFFNRKAVMNRVAAAKTAGMVDLTADENDSE